MLGVAQLQHSTGVGDVATADRRRSSRASASPICCTTSRLFAAGRIAERRAEQAGEADCRYSRPSRSNGRMRNGRADSPDAPFFLVPKGGTSNPTSLRPLAPEASASTSSTTSQLQLEDTKLGMVSQRNAPFPKYVLRLIEHEVKWQRHSRKMEAVDRAEQTRQTRLPHIIATWEAGSF